MTANTLNSSQFQAALGAESSTADPLLQAARRLLGDESVSLVVDPDGPAQEQDWDPWGA